MKIYTQKELLSESIWGGIQSAAKGVGKGIVGAARGVDYMLGQVAPEIQGIYKGAGKGIKNTAQELVQAVQGQGAPAKKGEQANVNLQRTIKNNLIRSGNRVSIRPVIYYDKDVATGKDIYTTYLVNQNTGREYAVYTDNIGNILYSS